MRIDPSRDGGTSAVLVFSGAIEPKTYADAVLRIRALPLTSPLPLAGGITASPLIRRIEAIVIDHTAPQEQFGHASIQTTLNEALSAAKNAG